MAEYVKNSLFVRNLSPNVSEAFLRDFFAECDDIEKITFKPFSTLNNQFFAQVDFASSKGVAEGSRLSGSSLLGVQCIIGVIDPLSDGPAPQAAPETEEEMAEQMKAETLRRACEADDDIRRRTIHISGLGEEMTFDFMRKMCTQFGVVDKVKIDTDQNGGKFALVEFREKGPAHVCKLQQQYAVNGRILIMTEAQIVCDEAGLTELGIEFEDPMINAMQMRSLLPHESALSEKVKKVAEAAALILPSMKMRDKIAPVRKDDGMEDWDDEQPEQLALIGPKRSMWDVAEELEISEAEKRKKKTKKEKTKEKKSKKRKLGSDQEDAGKDNAGKKGKKQKRTKLPIPSPTGSVDKKRRGKNGKGGRRKPKAKAGAKKKQMQKKEQKDKLELVSDETDGPIDLDEVEVVANTELVNMNESSSSSSSSTSSSALECGVLELDLVEDNTKVVEL